MSVPRSKLYSEDFYSRLSPTYRKALKELEKNLANLRCLDQKHPVFNENYYKHKDLANKYIDEFGAKYFLPKEIWDIRLCGCYRGWYTEETNKLRKIQAYKDFCYDKDKTTEVPFYETGAVYFWNDPNMEFKKWLLDIERKLKFPHKNIDSWFKYYKTHTSIPPSQNIVRTVKRMKAIYEEIKASENNLPRWFRALQKAGDFEFLQHNVEDRISKDLLNKDLWLLYLRYLKDSRPNDLPRVKAAYSRFWVNDKDFDIEKLEEVKGDTFPYEQQQVSRLKGTKRL